MTNSLNNLLKNTLISLYVDCPEIVDVLQIIDYTAVNSRFKQELFSRISEEDYDEVDEYLHSDKYTKYKLAIDEASLAITRQLSELIEFAIAEQTGEKH